MSPSRRTLSLLPLAAFAACAAPGPEVRVDYDHDADFGRFRTFGWASPLGTDGSGYTTLTTERLKAAARQQMESRGYVFTTGTPDLLVNFHLKSAQRTQVNTMAGPGFGPPGYYAYRFYQPWPAWGFGSETVVSQYTEGTLNIDLVDRARNRMVWEGVAIGRITQRDIDNPTTTIDQTMAAIFNRYPFVAGSGTPVTRPRT